MIPEIGQFALILALSLALCQGVLPLIGAHRDDAAMMSIARPAAAGQFLFVAVSFGCLIWAFVTDDFSVLYVANHSQLALPTGYKISAVWSAHEGSLLMWLLILAAWTIAVARYSKELRQKFAARGIGAADTPANEGRAIPLCSGRQIESIGPHWASAPPAGWRRAGRPRR